MPYQVNVIVPRGVIIAAQQYAGAIEEALDTLAVQGAQDFRKSTRTWKRKPSFQIGRSPGIRVIGTSNTIYTYVNHGTRPHAIRPRRPGGRLRFQVGGRAKTQPGRLFPTSGRRGSTTVYARGVRHPGTAARRFDRLVARRLQRRVRNVLVDALRSAQ